MSITVLLMAVAMAFADRVVNNSGVTAVGDVHGDLTALRSVLEMGGVINSDGNWICGTRTVVQIGDLVDRGPESDKVMDFIMKLRQEAINNNGRLILLIGNHELLSLKGDTEYVSQSEIDRLTLPVRNQLMSPTGKYGSFIVENMQAAYLQREIGTLFIHASPVIPEKTTVEQLNSFVQSHLREGSWNHTGTDIFGIMGPFWDRSVLREASRGRCSSLYNYLDIISKSEGVNVTKVVVGHTIQKSGGITSYCKNSLFAIDVGMSVGTWARGRRRALLILHDNGNPQIIHKNINPSIFDSDYWSSPSKDTHHRAGPSQGLVFLSFLATIVTPCIAAATVAFLVKMLRKCRGRFWWSDK